MRRVSLHSPRHLAVELVPLVLWGLIGAFDIPAASAEEVSLARELFQEGVGLYARGEYQAALERFESSYALNKRASVLFNIAMCSKALLLNVKALDAFQEFISEYGDAVEEQLLVDAERAVSQLRDMVGRLRITVRPADARIRVDNIERGGPPDHVLFLDIGAHEVVVEKKGFYPYRQQLELAGGEEATLDVVLTVIPPRPLPSGPPGITGRSEADERERPPAGVPERVEPPFQPDRVDAGRRRPMLWTGGGMTAAGAVLLGLGAYFNVRYFHHYDEGLTVSDDWKRDGRDEDEQKYETIRTKKLPADKRGLAIGYASGGVVAAAGIALLLTDVLYLSKKPEHTARRAGPSFSGHGVAVRF